MWVANLRGKPLPANLNLERTWCRVFAAAPQGTTVFLLRGQKGWPSALPKRFAAPLPICALSVIRTAICRENDEAELIDRLAQLRHESCLSGWAIRCKSSSSTVIWTTSGCAERCGLPSVVSSIITAERCGGRRLCCGGRDSNGCISSRSNRKAEPVFRRHPEIFVALCLRGADERPRHPQRRAVVSVKATVRGLVKRGLRQAVATAGMLSSVDESPRILCYHGVCDDPPDSGR